MSRMSSAPSTMPSSGETTMKSAVFKKKAASSEPNPAFTIAAPASPPMSACDDEVGKRQPPRDEVPGDGAAPARRPRG